MNTLKWLFGQLPNIPSNGEKAVYAVCAVQTAFIFNTLSNEQGKGFR